MLVGCCRELQIPFDLRALFPFTAALFSMTAAARDEMFARADCKKPGETDIMHRNLRRTISHHEAHCSTRGPSQPVGDTLSPITSPLEAHNVSFSTGTLAFYSYRYIRPLDVSFSEPVSPYSPLSPPASPTSPSSSLSPSP